MIPRVGCGFAAGFLLASSCGPLAASVPHYFVHKWQTDDGLPQNAVTAIVQTHDGYLWVGTYGGLARFDGVRFVVFDNGNTPEMHSSRVTSLYEDTQHNLWIGYETGELIRYRDQQFQPVKMVPAWNGRKIVAITEDRSGDIWLMGVDGTLARLKDGLILTPEASNASDVATLARDRRGRIWVLLSGRVSVLEGDRLVPAQFGPGPTNTFVQGICASGTGGLWVAGDGGVRKWKDHRWVENLGQPPWGMDTALAFIETRSGGLAAGFVDQGLYVILPGAAQLHFNRHNGLPSDWVPVLCQDREGDLWMGTRNGLVALRAGKVTVVNAPDQWQGRSAMSITASPSGALWIGTEGAGLYRLEDGQWRHFDAADGVSNAFVWSVSEDARGRLWAGTWGGGLLVQRGDRFERVPGLEDVVAPMPALLHVAPDDVWVGTGSGLLHYRAGKVKWYGVKEGLTFPDVRAVARDPDGTVWFGMLGGGLGRLREGTLRQFRKADGLSSDFVQCLRRDSDGALWIGTFGGGLSRLKGGRFATVGTSRGLPNNFICDIEDDGRGNFWVSSHGGIFRVNKQELNRCADGTIDSVHCLTYDTADGMPTLECSGGFQPAGCRTSDGRLWFPTSRGLVVVDPEEVKTNQLPPPVLIEELLVGGKPMTFRAADSRPLRIPPGNNRIGFHYTALSFAAPEKVRFKCRLEGLETEWEDAGKKRSVDYAFVPPGDYTFRVIACNNDGVWNDTGAALSFTLLPQFWQTSWFLALAGAVIMSGISGGVWFATRQRMRRKVERLERQRAVERERARIAKDIHDDLGASLTRITMLSQSAQGDLDNPSQAAANLDRIYGTARELTRAMDEIVWAVNPQHDTLDSLASYLGRFAQDFLGSAGVRCRLDVPVHLPAWPVTAEVRHNLFLAFKEALHNVLKHAAASEVRVSLVLQTPGFVLAVEDNGGGFAPDAAEVVLRADPDRPAHGNGLANMRRRLEEIGGRCEIHSTPRQGTKIRFLVPVSVHGSEAN